MLGSSNRPLKSLHGHDQGQASRRFRENLLGKRVDYSARSVIVVGTRAARLASADCQRKSPWNYTRRLSSAA